MHEDHQRAKQSANRSTPHTDKHAVISDRFEQFEKRQRELWLMAILIIFLLGVAYAWTSWDSIRSLAHHYEALPIGFVVLIVLFGVYMWNKTQEISELRGLMRGMEHRDENPPSEKQLDQLFEIISRSQQGYRDLIDSFDDILLAVSLDGQIRAVNRSFSDLVDTAFQQIIGKPLADFVQESSGEGARLVERAMPRFMERRQRAGVIQVRLKSQSSPFFFDCVAHAMMRGDKNEIERQPMIQGKEITLIRRDGTSIVCLNTAAAVRDNSGRVLRYQGALMDITERREMERRLHQQQEFARRLVDSFPDLILVLDANAHYTFVSPRCKDVLGYDIEEAQNMAFGGRTHPEDLPAANSLYQDIIAGRQSFASLEIRVRHKLGEWRRIRFNFSPLADEKGNVEGVVLSGRDVTDLKRLEEQLIQAEKLAAMGQMLAGVAHELNNPLTAILGVTELLRERQGEDDSTKRQLELTHRQARRAARIVQNLLEFSRPASPQKKPLDLNNLLERTLQLHEHSLRRNNVEMDFRLQPDLPGVIADANQLIQVFLNLVTNAEQAIREVRDSGRLQIRPGLSGNRISLTFQDDGVGIRPEALPRIFDPFYTTKRPGGGTGLGLSICMSIIREHGGLIEAEALPAGGTTFTVSLPPAPAGKSLAEKLETPAPSEAGVGSSFAVGMLGVTPEESSFPSVPAASVSANAPSASANSAAPNAMAMTPSVEIFKGRRVLVLDDEESLRLLLQEGLFAQGLRVDCAATTEDAVALLGRFWENGQVPLNTDNGDNGGRSSAAVASSPENGGRPGYDILLCDLHLSAGGYFVDGRQAAARLLEAAVAAGLPKPIVVYMSGDLVDVGLETPSRGEPFLLPKPFRISDVLALFREVLTAAPEPQPK